jgi:hypothetical protein
MREEVRSRRLGRDLPPAGQPAARVSHRRKPDYRDRGSSCALAGLGALTAAGLRVLIVAADEAAVTGGRARIVLSTAVR